MNINYIVIPLVGAFIGYITNSIAITMLFRPREAKYIGKWRVPFTPGIIPKEKERLSKAVANTICNHLLNSDVITRSLLSEESLSRLEGAIDKYFQKYRDSDMPLGEAIDELIGNKKVTSLATNATEKLSSIVALELSNFSMGQEIAKTSLLNLKENFSHEWGYKAILSKLLDDKVISSLSSRLGAQLNSLVIEKGPEVFEDFTLRQADSILNTPCSVYMAKLELTEIKSNIVSAYKQLINSHLSQLLSSLNLNKMIENRINDFEISEAETIIRSVINRELNAVIWLGALLGLIIGLLNLLFI